MTQVDPIPRRVVLVTGPSGAGRSNAIKVLEDVGFEAIDNLPLRLIPALLEEPSGSKTMALGIPSLIHIRPCRPIRTRLSL